MEEHKDTLDAMNRLGISQETMNSMKEYFVKKSIPILMQQRKEERERETEDIAQ